MTSKLFIITIAACIFVASAVDLLADVEKAIEDAVGKIKEKYGDDKLNQVQDVLDKGGDDLAAELASVVDQVHKILGISGGDGGSIGQDINEVDADLIAALKAVKDKVHTVFKAAKKGAKKGVEKKGRKMDN